MSQKKSTEPNTFGGVWSVQKLDCVSAYLKSYLSVFRNQPWADLWYIDAFCGDGVQGIKSNIFGGLWLEDDSELIEFVEGSALRALRIASIYEKQGIKTFDHFVFIEIDRNKLVTLEGRIAELYPQQLHKCEFIAADVNNVLPEVLAGVDWKTARAVSFVDPYATQLRWKTLEAFRSTNSDVWLLFPLEAIIRMLPINNMPNDSWSERLDNVFGDRGWRELYYDPTEFQPMLFDIENDIRERHEGIDELLRYTTSRLEELFSCVLKPGILRTEKNSPLFALYAAIANESEKAQKAASRIAEYLIKGLNE